MKKNKTIQVKATLLILVFSLNTVLGFACSLGLQMGYNEHHHEQKTGRDHSTQHQGHHKEGKKQYAASSNSSKNDCCSKGVTSFNLLDRSVSQQITIAPLLFAIGFPAAYFHIGLLQPHSILTNIRVFARSYHPPKSGIRIVIQSFLI